MKKQTVADKIYRAYISHGSSLDPRERDILAKYYGFGEERRHSLEEIGQLYSISRERIRQVKHHAITKLNAKQDEKNKSRPVR